MTKWHLPLADRFWAKVDQSEDCWLWNAQLKQGYGIIRIGPKQYQAHRVAYELMIEPIPTGLEMDHLCRNKACVNPFHVEPVTHKENMMRGAGVGSMNASKTHCMHGHEFNATNTILRSPRSTGRRDCRECGRIAVRKYQARIRGK